MTNKLFHVILRLQHTHHVKLNKLNPSITPMQPCLHLDFASNEVKISEYNTTNAEDEDLYTTNVRGKNKETLQGKYEWFGVGASLTLHVVTPIFN
jgi:hypothetical protein